MHKFLYQFQIRIQYSFVNILLLFALILLFSFSHLIHIYIINCDFMFHIRKLTRLVCSLPKPTFRFPSSITYQPSSAFSNSKQPPAETLNQAKSQGKQFYQNHIESIIELQKLQDWQTIVGGCTETLLIDFYADWCGPCKKLTPRLEKRVNESAGKLKLLKINIDKFGQIAQAFQIKSVPTVYMVYGGKAIDAFTGELNDEQLTKFLETATRVAQPDAEELNVVRELEQGQILLRQKKFQEAEKVLGGIKYNKVREEFKLVGDIFLALVYAQLGKMVQLKSYVQTMKVNALFYTEKPEFESLFSHLCQKVQTFEKEKQQNNQVGSWKQRLQSDPSNLSLKFEAAQFYRQNAMVEQCLQQLLAIIKINKEWEDKKANKQMLAIFKELGNSSPLVQTYRKHLQRTMY